MRLLRIAASGILVLLAILEISSSCTSKGDCPAYDGKYLELWFPYKAGDQKIFASSSQQTDTLVVRRVNTTEGYSYQSQKAVYCASSGEIYCTKIRDSSYKGEYFYLIDKRDMADINELFFRVRQFAMQADSLVDTGFVNIRQHLITHTAYQYGPRVYPLVQEIFSIPDSTTAAGSAYRVFIAKGFGLIGYETYPDHISWWLR